MSQSLPKAVNAFKELFSGSNIDLEPFLRDDAELRPPTYGKSWFGKSLVAKLAGFAASEFGGLSYSTIWQNGENYVLRFSGHLDGKPVSGVDIVELDENGLIQLIEIFARPPGQMLQLRDRMGEHIRHNPDVAALMGLA